jgi:hypothetical protein
MLGLPHAQSLVMALTNSHKNASQEDRSKQHPHTTLNQHEAVT